MLKFIERVRARLLNSTAAGVIAVLALGGTVAAITSPDFTYTTKKTGYFSISPMALSPNSNVANYLIPYSSAYLVANNSGCFSTGVNLPQGSRITQLAVWYASPGGSDPTVYLQREVLAGGPSASLLTSGTIMDDAFARKLAVLPIAGGSSLVSNIGFVYGFGICPGVSGYFYGARIAYTYTSAGD